ncbi:MAG: glycine cleavage system H protein [Acidimicrobiia bacterium]|nr:MAG: glycine cleavage system H protein [Acidimicrobiia bacterium]
MAEKSSHRPGNVPSTDQEEEMRTPEEFRYTEEHEWVLPVGDGRVRMGITDYAQDQLGDVVFVQLPETGSQVEKGAVIAEVESTKSVGEVYAPVSGTVVAVNEAVLDRPELINQDPYGDGWLIELETDDPIDQLLDAESYLQLIDRE